jgi:hypothetical protein
MILIYLFRFVVGWIFAFVVIIFALIYRVISWDWSGDMDGNKIIISALGKRTLNAMMLYTLHSKSKGMTGLDSD